MTPRELKRIKRTLDTLEAGFTKRALQHFTAILPEVEPFVEDVLRTGNPDSFEMPGKKRYLVLFKRYVQECFVQGMSLADQELLARRAQFDDQKLEPAPVIPEEAMAWMDRWTERFGPDYYGDLTQDVVLTLKRALAEGLSVEHTMDQLEHVLTGPAYNKNRLDVIARTNATTAFNQGRLEMFNQAADFVPYVEFLAILDSRTTDICEARNGKIFKTGSADLAANTPPLHYRCRSILSPVTIYDLEDMHKAGWRDPEGRTLQQKMDRSGMPELPKGFGNVGKALDAQPSVTSKMGGRIDSGARNKDNIDAEQKLVKAAEKYYNKVRQQSNDVEIIAKNTGIPEDDIRKVKEHLFLKEYVGEDGIKYRFDPDRFIAASWARMHNKKSIKNNDLILVRHELEEQRLMNEEKLSYKMAHRLANEKYNWEATLDE